MAGTTTSQIKDLRDQSSQDKDTLTQRKTSELEARRGNPIKLMEETLRYEKYCKYWSILSNVAAIVSVSSAIFTIFNKRRFW